MTRRFLAFLLDILPGLILLAALALALLFLLPTPRGEPQTDLGSSGGAAVLPGAPDAGLAQLGERRINPEVAGAEPVPGGESLFGAPPHQAGQEARPESPPTLAAFPEVAGVARYPVPKVDASSCVTPCFVTVGWLVRQGIASTYGPRYSEWWVALPDGPGWRFRVCGPGGCRTLVSTDAGPAKYLQRAPYNRVVDLPVGAFSDVCGVAWWYGLCNVELTMLGPAR